MPEAEVDAVGYWDGTDDDDCVGVHVRACARRLVDGLQCGDNYLVVKAMMIVSLSLSAVLVMSAGRYVDMHVYLHFRVRVNRDENVWTEMR